MTESQPARRYRFGAFEADSATGELRRQGILIKLNAQPFQVLLMLLDRPSQLLTREEISRELWPDGTFVDYEHGVNSAVNRIREALGDTAGNSRFVQTLARRGYRFVAPVERIVNEGNSSSTAFEPASAPPLNLIVTEQAGASAEIESKIFGRILASPEELPKASYPVVQTLFVLMQLMYVGFYVGALANLAEIEDLFSALPRATQAFTVLVVTAAILIPVRAFLLSAVLFRAPGAREKFLRIWPFLLALDELWSLAPFLLLHHINFGLALACTTLLVYSPFAQRTLVLMGAGGLAREISATVR
ncbi:MAG TPA: winged helix-turn-helix domain-containing protein [Terracidiphilus sp.]|nr:winged helix-turn-helix domain-containing protein [Terracidiphilus sp.]